MLSVKNLGPGCYNCYVLEQTAFGAVEGLALKWGTVTRSVMQGLEPKGELIVRKGMTIER